MDPEVAVDVESVASDAEGGVVKLRKDQRLNDEQLRQIAQEFAALNVEERELVLANETLKGFLPETKALYKYLAALCDVAPGQMVVPLMSVLGALGMNIDAYQTKRDFIGRVLKQCNQIIGKDWIHLSKNEVFARVEVLRHAEVGLEVAQDQTLKFPVPGKPATFFEIKVGASPNAKFAFLTPECALTVACITGKPSSRQLCCLVSKLAYLLKKHTPPVIYEKCLTEAAEYALQTIPLQPDNDPSIHDIIKHTLAAVYKGTTEMRNNAGIADIETPNEVIEIKPLSEWAHGVGQVLAYSHATSKSARLVLFGKDLSNTYIEEVCRKHDIILTFIKL